MYFIIFISFLFLYTLGYLLGITSKTFEGAFNGLKVEYLGKAFLSQIFLLFIMDFCDLKIKKRLILPLCVIPFVTIALVWTNDYHQYYYAEMAFVAGESISQAAATVPGVWYYIHYLFAVFCLLAAGGVIAKNYSKLSKNMKKQVPLILTAALVELVSEFIHMSGVIPGGVFYPVLWMAVAAVLLFNCLIKYDTFDVASQSGDLALNFMSDSFLLFDKEQCFLKGNRAADGFLNLFGEIKKGSRINTINSWPKELSDLELAGQKNDGVTFEVSVGGHMLSFHADINALTVVDDQSLGWVLMVRDITETKALMERMESIAFTDTLTGIMNRDKFIELARMEFDKNWSDKNRKFSIITIGMDNYKKINDTYGGYTGDILLRLVSKNLKSILKDYPLFARYSGAQFVLLADIGIKQAEELAERIKNEIACRVYEINGEVIKCTASIGIAGKSPGAPSLDAVIKNSGEALRYAQIKGYNLIECYF